MKRADRLLQIEMLLRESERCRALALKSSRRPLALFNRYPVLAMTVSALLLGALSRGLVALPLPGILKLISVPVLRTAASAVITLAEKPRV